MLYARSLRFAKNIAYSLKVPSFQATRSHPGKARIYEPMALNKTMLPMRKNENLTITRTQQRTQLIPTPISTKKKEWEMRKKSITISHSQHGTTPIPTPISTKVKE